MSYRFKIQAKKNPVNSEVKYYPQAAPMDPVGLNSIVSDIEKMCTVSSPDVKAVLDALQYALITRLKEGQSVRLGDLGSFRSTLKGEGSESADAVTSRNIERVRVQFSMSSYMKRALSPENITFSQVKAEGE